MRAAERRLARTHVKEIGGENLRVFEAYDAVNSSPSSRRVSPQ